MAFYIPNLWYLALFLAILTSEVIHHTQVEGVAEVHKTFSAEMMFAAQYGKEERAKMVEKAINKDLAYMNYMLSDTQYRKYLMLLNLTLVNRGLK